MVTTLQPGELPREQGWVWRRGFQSALVQHAFYCQSQSPSVQGCVSPHYHCHLYPGLLGSGLNQFTGFPI